MSNQDGKLGFCGQFIDSANKSRLFVIIVAAALFFSFGYGVKAVNESNFQLNSTYRMATPEKSPEKSLSYSGQWKVIILIIWITVPPIWFFGEYYCIEKQKMGKFTSGDEVIKFQWEHFK